MTFEVMLKMGIPLDYTITKIKVNHKKVYLISKDYLILIKHGIVTEDIEIRYKYGHVQIVVAEKSFLDDTALSNALYP